MDSHAKTFKGLGVLHMNCRSYYGKKDEIRKLFDNFDIITFSETWLKDKHVRNMIQWPGKTLFRLDRKLTKAGGVMCLVPNILAPYCTVNKNLTITNTNLECLTINIAYPNWKKKIVSTIYRPPGKDINVLTELIRLIGENSDQEIWICGDYNIDFRKTDSECFKNIVGKCKVFGTLPLINQITRYKKKKNGKRGAGSSIDNIITNCKHVSESGVHDVLISDHLPVFAVKKKQKLDYVVRETIGRTYKNYNFNDLAERLLFSDSDYFNNLSETGKKWEFIITIITDYLE